MVVDTLYRLTGTVDVRPHGNGRVDDEHHGGAEPLERIGIGLGVFVRALLVGRLRRTHRSDVEQAHLETLLGECFLCFQHRQQIEALRQIHRVIRLAGNHSRITALGLHVGQNRLEQWRRVVLGKELFEAVLVTEEQQRITTSRVGQRQGHLHFPRYGAVALDPADGLAIAVRADLQPLGVAGLLTLVYVKAGECWLHLTATSASTIAKLAGRRGQHALVEGLLAFLQQRFVCRHQWRCCAQQQAGKQQLGAWGGEHGHFFSSSSRWLAS